MKGVASLHHNTEKNGRSGFRRTLKNMVYDKNRIEFVEWKLQKKNRLRTKIKVDVTNYNILKTALTERPSSVPMEKGAKVESVSIGDTGASVTCSGISLMQDLGWKVGNLLETEVKLLAANKKQLTVLGALPVQIRVKTVEGNSEVMMRGLLYVVEELAGNQQC